MDNTTEWHLMDQDEAQVLYRHLPMYPVKNIAEALNCHPETVRRYIRAGKLKAYHLGRSWRVSINDLKKFIEEYNKEKY